MSKIAFRLQLVSLAILLHPEVIAGLKATVKQSAQDSIVKSDLEHAVRAHCKDLEMLKENMQAA